MRLSNIARLFLAAALSALLIGAIGCGSYGGADVYLEKVSIGNMSVEGKPITGLPAQTVNIVLKANANKVLVSQSEGKTIIRLQPSGAVITSSSEGLSLSGVKAEQVEMKWNSDNTTK